MSGTLHLALAWAMVAGTAVAPTYTPEQEERAAQFLLPLRQPAPRPVQERLTFVGLYGAPLSPPAPKPEFTDRYVEKKAEVQTPETKAAEGSTETPQRAYSELEVDSTALRDPSSEGPAYPPDLLARGVEGKALVRFVVNADGSVDVATFAVIASSDTGFTRAARDVLPRMRFRPAWFSGRAVPQLVEQEFTFRIRKPA